MRRSASKQFRALALIALLALAAVPASAAPREGNGPGFEQRIVRFINRALRHFGVSISSDEISIPKP